MSGKRPPTPARYTRPTPRRHPFKDPEARKLLLRYAKTSDLGIALFCEDAGKTIYPDESATAAVTAHLATLGYAMRFYLCPHSEDHWHVTSSGITEVHWLRAEVTRLRRLLHEPERVRVAKEDGGWYWTCPNHPEVPVGYVRGGSAEQSWEEAHRKVRRHLRRTHGLAPPPEVETSTPRLTVVQQSDTA